MTSPAARLWFGRTVHRREAPFVRRFSYRIAMVEVDVDRLGEAGRMSRLLAIDRPAAVSLRQTDHGAKSPAVSLRRWAEARLAEAGVYLDSGPVRLVTFPRVLGYGFAPISVWLGYGPQEDLRGVIYEVHNTFGETHAYVSPFDGDRIKMESEKEFFVSPFFDVDGRYRFTLRPPQEGQMGLVVENLGPEGRRHVASLKMKASGVSGPAIVRWLVVMPLSGLGAMIAIHWQALCLLLKGAGYRVKPPQRPKRTTLTQRRLDETARGNDVRNRA